MANYSKQGMLSVDNVALSNARLAAGLSMLQVSQQLECNIGKISHWEQGKLAPSEEMILKLVRIYGTESFVRYMPFRVVKRILQLEERIRPKGPRGRPRREQ